MKTFYIMCNVGKAKYLLNYNDGITKNQDGSDFIGIAIYHNKKELAKRITILKKAGYMEV